MYSPAWPRTHNEAQAVLELEILLFLHLKGWVIGYVLLCLV
jgi:hypothetical protein